MGGLPIPLGVEGRLEIPFADKVEQFSEEQFGTIPGRWIAPGREGWVFQ